MSALVALLWLGACSSELEGAPTQSICPPDSTLTYANFGQPFMEAYCVRCHSSARAGKDRHGAPLYHDLDSLEGILPVGEHIDEQAAAGPASENELMPPSAPRPTRAERLQLGEWLACALSP